MPEPKRAFIFDLDGTLVDTMPSHFVAWTEIARRHGFTFPEARFYSLGGVPTAKIAAMLIAEAGLTLDPVAIALEKEQMYYDSLASGGGVQPIAAVLEIGAPGGARARWRSRRAACGGSSPARSTPWGSRTGSPSSSPPRTQRATNPSPTSSWRRPAASASNAADCTVYEDTDIGLEAAAPA